MSSSFERFQRDARSRSSYHSSQRSSKLSINSGHRESRINGSAHKNQNNHGLDLMIIPEDISFIILPGTQQSLPFTLNLVNNSPERIYYKIRSSSINSDNYRVSPYEEVIEKGKSLGVIFIFMRKNRTLLESFQRDRFEIQWGAVPEVPNVGVLLTDSQRIGVKVVEGARDSAARWTLGKQPSSNLDRTSQPKNKRFSSEYNPQTVSQNNQSPVLSQNQKRPHHFQTSINDSRHQSQPRDNVPPPASEQEVYYNEWMKNKGSAIKDNENKIAPQLMERAFQEVNRRDSNAHVSSQGLAQSIRKVGAKQEREEQKSLLTRTNIIAVAVISFILGFISV